MTDLDERRREGLELQARLPGARYPRSERPTTDAAVEGATWGVHAIELGILGAAATAAAVLFAAVTSISRRRR